MQITATDLPGAARFYSETLGLPVQLAPDRATVSIGDSTLTMVPGPAYHGAHHIAFTIPARSLASAKQWLSRRVTLQADGEWHDEFDCPPHWRARSIYFAGPDDAVLELIERNVLDNRIERAFGVGDIRYISEVGFGVPDVLQTQLQLRDTLGLLPFGEPNPRFCPVGDHDGLFILVPADATWRPEHRVAPAAAHIVVTADIPTALEIGEHYLVQPRPLGA
ncbi:Glyoxalase-like domain [Mycobacteroides abscessus subsp. abscessus]|nr:Glyoxalase-like domain [Mycobacteroides abscessus subsp. abscessus]SKX87167.1 Glyoxalase-like domain [Mycobacteroides abscessus subsp. abscessus]